VSAVEHLAELNEVRNIGYKAGFRDGMWAGVLFGVAGSCLIIAALMAVLL
jgi:hypothetical protein